MVRIPRAEPALQTQIADMPMSTGDGYAAPGKGLAQLGQGISALGAGINSAVAKQNAEAEKENAALDQLDLFERQRKSEADYGLFKDSYTRDESNDGAGFARQAQGVVSGAYADFSPRSKQYQGAKGQLVVAKLVDPNRFHSDERAIRQNVLIDRTQQSLTGLFDPLLTRDLPEDQFRIELDKTIKSGAAIIQSIPVGPKRKQIEDHFSDMVVKSIAGRNLDALPTVMDVLKGLKDSAPSAPSPSAPGKGAAITPSTGGHSIVQGGGGAKFRVASDYAPRFAGLVADLEAAGVAVKGDQSGGYANRNIAGTNTKSRHASGEAVDINWTDNPRGASGEISKQISPDKIRDLAAKHGLKWGGDWKNPDPMHFEVDRNAKPVSVAGQSARAENTIPSGGGQLAQAKGGTLTDVGPQVPAAGMSGLNRAITDKLITNLKTFEAQHQKFLLQKQNLQTVAGWVSGAQPFNKHADDDRKLLDKTLKDSGLGTEIFAGNPQALSMGVVTSQRLGYAPNDVQEGLLGLIHSQEPKKRVMGYESAASIQTHNPSSFTEGDDGKKLAKEAVSYKTMVQTGRTPEQALARIDEMRSPDWKLKSDARKKQAEVTSKTFTAATIASEFDPSSGWQINPNTQDGELIAHKYKQAYEEAYIETGDDAIAKRRAALDLQKTYGLSTFKSGGPSMFGGGTVMLAPPERSYPMMWNPDTKAIDHGWIAKDVEGSVAKWAGEKIPLADIEVRGDSRTLDQIAAGKPPSYEVWYKTKDKAGYPVLNLIPHRWSVPADVQKMMQEKATTEFKVSRDTQAKAAGKGFLDVLREPIATPRAPTPTEVWTQDQIKRLRGWYNNAPASTASPAGPTVP